MLKTIAYVSDSTEEVIDNMLNWTYSKPSPEELRVFNKRCGMLLNGNGRMFRITVEEVPYREVENPSK